jgi:hypothetical protein
MIGSSKKAVFGPIYPEVASAGVWGRQPPVRIDTYIVRLGNILINERTKKAVAKVFVEWPSNNM